MSPPENILTPAHHRPLVLHDAHGLASPPPPIVPRGSPRTSETGARGAQTVSPFRCVSGTSGPNHSEGAHHGRAGQPRPPQRR